MIRGALLVAAGMGIASMAAAKDAGPISAAPHNSPCCRTPPSWYPPHLPFPPNAEPHGGDNLISSDSIRRALKYIRGSRYGARVVVQLHGPSFHDPSGEAEFARAEAVARHLIAEGVPPGAIDGAGILNDKGDDRRWISIAVDRLARFRTLRAKP